MNSVFKTPDLANTFESILDTFSGADGGIRFVRFRIFLEEIELLTIKGDEHACEILKIVKQFKMLIDIANE